MTRFKFMLEYDGGAFVGWQRQDNGMSVQQALEEAVFKTCAETVTAHAAGRTDAGVHALGQVASARVTFSHDPATLIRALNVHLPPEIRVLSVEDAPDDFHARFSASGKTYRYRIRNTPVADPFDRAFSWHLPEPLSLDAMNRAAALLVGTPDFNAFRSVGNEPSTTMRTMTRGAVPMESRGYLGGS